MSAMRQAAVLGASMAAAAGFAYFLWTQAPSSGQGVPDRPEEEEKKEEEQEEEEKKEEEEEKKEEEEHEERSVSAAQAQKTAARPAESEGSQVLVLGLDGAGKSSLLHCFATGSLNQDMQPTQGFNAVSISRDSLHVEFQEIGGREDLRPYWQKYLSQALLLVFVVDSSDPKLFPAAKEHLHQLLSSRPGLPLMVLANKQDLPGSCSITDVHDALCLSDIGERQLFLVGTHVRKGDAELSSGVQDAWEMIVQMVCGDR